MEPVFHYSRSFVESAEHLNATNPAAWAHIVAARDYLREFRRAAVAPDVRWHIATSCFAENCGELRWPDPEDQSAHPDVAIRGLFVANPNDEWYVFTVLGNKAVGPMRGNAWYQHAIAQSDSIAQRAIATLKLSPFPSE